MIIKAVDIARELGLSKATVSLALNNRPGVSEETRREILACKARLEKFGKEGMIPPGTGKSNSNGRQIMVLQMNKGKRVAFNSEMDLWTDVLSVIQNEAQKAGYETCVRYVDVREDPLEEVIERCNVDHIAGVVLVATELDEKELVVFEKMKTPMIIYDNESSNNSKNCVVPDNYKGVENAVLHLFRHGMKDIVYLCNDEDIYNFRTRRDGYCGTMLKHGLNPFDPERMIQIGGTINEVDERMSRYLETHRLPEAFIMENYQVTIGVTRALHRKQIRIPEDISLIGIDKIPDYLTGDIAITTVQIPHTERAVLTMLLLLKEIEEIRPTKSRVMAYCPLIEGDSVRMKKS